MMKHIVILMLILSSTKLYGQNKGYVILRRNFTVKQTKVTVIDTLYGQIFIPKSGVIYKIKFLKNKETKKYTPKDLIGFGYDTRYFESVPYSSKGKVFAERIVNGKIESFYYDSSPKGYSPGLVGGISSGISTSLTSYYFVKVKTDTNHIFLKVPHSREKAQKELSTLFKDNENIYNKILSEEFRVWKLPEIVKESNDDN